MQISADTITNTRGDTFRVGDTVQAATFAGPRTGIIVTIWAFGATPVAVRIGNLISDFTADDLNRENNNAD